LDTNPGGYYMVDIDFDKIQNTQAIIFKELNENSFNYASGIWLNQSIDSFASSSGDYFLNNFQDYGRGMVNYSYSGYNPIEMNYNKVGYFYNSGNFSIYVFAGLHSLTTEISDLIINNISYCEVDKIPFFKYFQYGSIDQSIKTPLKAVAPYIDYNNSNFDFIGNVNLTFDSQGILNQQVINSTGDVSTVSSGGFSTVANWSGYIIDPSKYLG
jgi:hypothetical protein